MSAKTNILYVDDEPDIRLIVEMALQLNANIDVRTAESGKQALDILNEQGWLPRLALVDVMMPEMDGPTFVKHLRDRPQTADLPVVFVTAKARQQDIEAYIAMGAKGVITKPFDPMTLADQALAFIGENIEHRF